METITIRPITPADDAAIARIIRDNLKAHHLDIPGTAYFDPELTCLSGFYRAKPDRRAYIIAANQNGIVIGGVGIAEFEGLPNCAELQKLYLCDGEKGKGYGKLLMQTAVEFARSAGYDWLYLETHTNLEAAIGLYEKMGFRRIEKPEAILHSTMNRFYWKRI